MVFAVAITGVAGVGQPRAVAVTGTGPFTVKQHVTLPAGTNLGTVDSGFTKGGPVVGDFNGDGRSDVLLYGAGSTADELWYGSSAGYVAGPSVTVNGYYTPVVGDFNGDGKDDVLWYPQAPYRHSSSASLWLGANSGFVHGPTIPAPPMSSLDTATFFRPLVGDFNGDGRSDIFWLDGESETLPFAPNALWYGAASGFTVGPNTTSPIPVDTAHHFLLVDAPIVGDFNGDGRTDLLWNQFARTVLWRGAASGFTTVAVPRVYNFYTPVTGDFNGDGRDDVLWYAVGSAKDTLWQGTANGFSVGPPVVINGDYEPLTGDFNGDGRRDILWDDSTHGGSYAWFGATNGFTHTASFATPTSVARLTVEALPTAGDVTGDGHDDLTWWVTTFNAATGAVSNTATLWAAH